MKEITHDLTFYCTHTLLCVSQYKVAMFRVLGMYNFVVHLKLVSRHCAVKARTRNEAMADARFPKRPLARELLLSSCTDTLVPTSSGVIKNLRVIFFSIQICWPKSDMGPSI